MQAEMATLEIKIKRVIKNEENNYSFNGFDAVSNMVSGGYNLKGTNAIKMLTLL